MINIKPVFRQIFASSATILLFLGNGYILGIQSVILPQLRKENSTLTLDLHQESWITSVPLLTLFPTQLACGALTYRYGRKRVLCCSIIPAIITPILMYNAKDYLSLLFAFVIFGLVGGGISVGTMMIAELCSPKHRAAILNVKTATLPVGLLLAHLFGNFYDWRTLSIFGVIPNVFAFIIAASSPDSPPWLAARGRFDDCRKAFEWLRGDEDQHELNKLIESRQNMLQNDRVKSDLTGWKKKMKYIFDRSFLKAMAISIACILFLDVSGKQVFSLYAIDAITTILGDAKYAYYCAVSLDLCDITTLTVSCVLVKRYKMRSYLFKTAFAAIITLLSFCLLSYLFANDYIPNEHRWVTLLAIFLYFTLVNIGVVPTLFAVLSEICPLSHREFGLGVTSFVFISLLFSVTKVTPYLMKYCELHGTFLLNSTVITLSITYLYFFMPETSNKTLQDIEDELKGGADKSGVTVELKEQMLPKSHP